MSELKITRGINTELNKNLGEIAIGQVFEGTFDGDTKNLYYRAYDNLINLNKCEVKSVYVEGTTTRLHKTVFNYKPYASTLTLTEEK